MRLKYHHQKIGEIIGFSKEYLFTLPAINFEVNFNTNRYSNIGQYPNYVSKRYVEDINTKIWSYNKIYGYTPSDFEIIDRGKWPSVETNNYDVIINIPKNIYTGGELFIGGINNINNITTSYDINGNVFNNKHIFGIYVSDSSNWVYRYNNNKIQSLVNINSLLIQNKIQYFKYKIRGNDASRKVKCCIKEYDEDEQNIWGNNDYDAPKLQDLLQHGINSSNGNIKGKFKSRNL